MSTFLARRLVLAIPVFFGILLVTFSLNRLIPGDPCRAVLGERATDADLRRLYRAQRPEQADSRSIS